MQEAGEVEEEGIAAETSEELCSFVTLSDVGLGRQRHGRVVGQGHSSLLRWPALHVPGQVSPHHRCELFAVVVFGREPALEHDLGFGIAVSIDERFVHGVGAEFSRVRRRQRVDIEDENSAVWMIRLLKRVVIGDVDSRIYRG